MSLYEERMMNRGLKRSGTNPPMFKIHNETYNLLIFTVFFIIILIVENKACMQTENLAQLDFLQTNLN